MLGNFGGLYTMVFFRVRIARAIGLLKTYFTPRPYTGAAKQIIYFFLGGGALCVRYRQCCHSGFDKKKYNNFSKVLKY